MLDILARTFLTATRVNTPVVSEKPEPTPAGKTRWAAPAHWWQRTGYGPGQEADKGSQ